MKVENFFIEILGRKHLKLLDPYVAFVIIGDVGARIYLYYSGCKEQLQLQRSAGRQIVERVIDWKDDGTQLSQQFYGQGEELRNQWKEAIEELLSKVKDEDYLARILSNNLKRTYRFTEVVDWSNLHYV